MEFKLPVLDYSYNALEPYIDALTMEIHHTRHHQTYLNNFNLALKDVSGIENLSAQEIVARVDELVSESKRQVIINHGGGYINHNLFFDILGQPGTKPSIQLAKAIDDAFGSMANFEEQFTQAATTQFGSGWAWLVVNGQQLEIVKTANQDSPVSIHKTPILGIDVWEHAYYLNYQNKRPEYISNFFKVINWEKVSKRYEEAL